MRHTCTCKTRNLFSLAAGSQSHSNTDQFLQYFLGLTALQYKDTQQGIFDGILSKQIAAFQLFLPWSLQIRAISSPATQNLRCLCWAQIKLAVLQGSSLRLWLRRTLSLQERTIW